MALTKEQYYDFVKNKTKVQAQVSHFETKYKDEISKIINDDIGIDKTAIAKKKADDKRAEKYAERKRNMVIKYKEMVEGPEGDAHRLKLKQRYEQKKLFKGLSASDLRESASGSDRPETSVKQQSGFIGV